MTSDELSALFFPHFQEKIAPLAAGGRLVHYTSAENAYRIITGAQVWLRSAHLMNDYSEMRHGFACLNEAWKSPAGIRLKTWLDEHWEGLGETLQGTFNSHLDGLTNHTYLMSLSQHDDDEDEFGRLSMWRAYGSRAGVALVLNTSIFLSETTALAVYSVPVTYRNVEPFVLWFETWVNSLIAAHEQLVTQSRETIFGSLFHTFRTFVLATKHPGFAEEKEWRVFHSPLIDGESSWVKREIEVIDGAPQLVFKIHLRDDEEAGVVGIAPNNLINRVIIGPCEAPLPIRNALGLAMEQAGVTDVGNKVWMSFIPLRQR